MNLKSSQSSYSSEETLSDAITRIMDEEQDWLRIMNLEGDKLLSVYLDMKSPHAYIAVRPTLEVARDYRVKIDFRPYTLSYTSLGLTTSLEDNKRQPPTPEGDRKARMYYATGRQYAALQKIPFRTPYRLLDSELANRVFLFAKQQGLEIPFIMDVFLRGWGSGWRDYEIESLLALRSSLIKTGADTDGLDEFVAPNGPGQQALMTVSYTHLTLPTILLV